MRDTMTPSGLGQILVTVGLAVGSAAAVFMLQFGAMEARLEEGERHLHESHPSQDYRNLIEGRIDRNKERIDRHETFYHRGK